MTARVEVSGLVHRFGQFEAISNIEVTIEAGQFAVLLGPSGCGKTTLLSILGGFLTPAEGRVLIDGLDVTHLAPAARPTTTMFQDYALFPHMTLIDNVAFGLRMKGIDRRRRRGRALEMLELVGLVDAAQKKPHQISGGQRQRVALARALAVKPSVLLLDEPLGALDLRLRRQMQEELKEIQRNLGTTFVHVTHDQEEAMAIADQIIVMNAGQIEDAGAPDRIYLRPQSRFGAGFMGEANVLEASVSGIDGDLISLSTPLGKLKIRKQSADTIRFAEGQSVSLCLRPEHVRIDNGVDSESTSKWHYFCDARVVDHVFSGAFRRYHVRPKSQAAVGTQLETLIVTTPPALALHEGEDVRVSLDVESAVIIPE